MNVLYVHLYISSMKEFGLANEVYVSFITEKKCYLGVPSRSTIELPLVQGGLGKAYVEVLVSNEVVKRVLHVQSISCWAPSCIGPYSQVQDARVDSNFAYAPSDVKYQPIFLGMVVSQYNVLLVFFSYFFG